MTSRVQKGGPIFKPIAKSRARGTSTAPRQASTPAPAEGPSSVASTGDVSTPTMPSSVDPPLSMPPPTTIPNRVLEPDIFRVVDPPLPPVASSSRTVPVIVASGSRITAPPVIAKSSQIASNIVSQPRNSPAPPTISRITPVPIVRPTAVNPPAPSPTLVNPTNDGPVLNPFRAPPQNDFVFPAELSQLIAPSNPSTLIPTPDSSAPTPENSAKKKLRKRKKRNAVSDADGDATATEGETLEKPKRARRKRAKKDAVEDDAFADGDGDATVTEGETSEKPKKARKKRAKKDTGEDDAEAKPKKKAKRKAKAAESADEESSPPKKRTRTAPPVFDPDADPGEEIDPTVVTMAELCVDNGQGRISSKALEIQANHLAWKQQSKEKRARMKALAEQKKYGRPDEDEEGNAAEAPAIEAPAAPDESGEVVVGASEPADAPPAIADASGSGFDYSQDLTASRFTVQVRIGPNGETIIDEESLTVDRTEEPDTTNYTHVVESDRTKFVNSASYTKKCRGSRWSAEETDLFFEALSQHGENYELISLVLPGRSRTACKNKFKAEDKKDSARITRCLESRIPIDMQTLGRLTGRDFTGPTPIIRVPTPPPAPDPGTQSEPENQAPFAARKRSRSRTAPSMEGVQIIGDAESYDA
ncbi:hypothetical protein C8F04DRAFT_1083465 [Mycena alexandri]|uniref:Myb-like domain-containing protein n=1 Tax=Mycena alexandri TaxID=1745969 RepID=A0AAD6T5Y7_9AGAR|nr:hypothetical protein C8F04DRAFT_1083465 [Mycena alexandri]